MNNRFQNFLFTLAFSLLLLPILVESCCNKPVTCHQAIKVINNSEGTVSVRTPSMYLKPNGVEYVRLDDSHSYSILSRDTAVIPVIMRHCLEEYDTPMLFYVLPESFPCIETTWDSLYTVYDILKTINLQELGVDSLIKTDYTVYFP